MSWILSTKSVVTAGLLACGSLFAQTASVQTAHSLSEEPTLAPPIARYAPRDMRPDGRGNFPTTLMNLRRSRLAGGAAVASGNGINYHNGPVMLGTTHIYYIWYGDWSQDTSAAGVLNNFANNIGGSPYFNINTTYTDSSKNAVSNSVTLAGSINDTSTKTSLSDADIWSIVTRSFSNGFSVDPNGIYVVLTAPGVTATSGFLTAYCGWHNYSVYNGVNVKYSFVGDAKGPSLGSCAIQTAGSPNGDPSVDAMVSVLAHELEETVSDPQLNAWSDSSGQENADKCAWTFGTTYSAGGGIANMKLGTMDYLIQRNWVNASGGSCGLSYTGAPDYSLSVSPSSQTVAAGSKSSNYTITVNASNGFSSAVSFTVSGLPTGVTLSPAPTSSKSSSTFAVQVGATAVAGSYTLTINGTSGSLKHSISTTLVITSNKTYTITVSPSTLTVKKGNTGQFTIVVSAKNGFNSAVRLAATGTPDRTTATLTSSSINGQGSSTLRMAPASNASAGAYTITVSGTSGSASITGTATLVVQ